MTHKTVVIYYPVENSALILYDEYPSLCQFDVWPGSQLIGSDLEY